MIVSVVRGVGLASPPTAGTPMSLQEARAVTWLRSNPRPMGELLDTGYLNQSRLAWAAEKAYDPQLRTAAGVLLEWLTKSDQAAPSTAAPPTPPSVRTSGGAAQPPLLPVVDAGITLEQARAVPWPFNSFRGQRMGDLVDSNQLSLKDLVYAIENAWDQRVRQAATVLVAVRLNQVLKVPPSPAGPLEVVSYGRSYSEAGQFRWTLVYGMLLSILCTHCVLLAIWVIRSFMSRPVVATLGKATASPIGIIALLIIVGLTTGAVWLTSSLLELALSRIERRIANYRKGQEGEEQIVELLRRNLDGRWTLVRNVVLPGRNQADIDAVLIGAPGIWALEIKMFTGEYENIGERWQYRAGKRWRLLKKSPSRQARDNAVRLANFLKADGIRQWVTPAVIWANAESPLSVENPATAVWTVERLPEELGNLWQGRDIGEADLTRVTQKLTGLCRSNAQSSNSGSHARIAN